MKIALCFYGITRSLKKTIHSINENILDIFTKNNIEYDVYLHTFDIDMLNLSRSNEIGCKLDREEWKLLNPIKYSVDIQEDFDKKYDETISKICEYGDAFNTGFKNTKNCIRSYYSIKKVTLLTEGQIYDKIIYLRPDLIYIEKLDLSFLHEKDSKHILYLLGINCILPNQYKDFCWAGDQDNMTKLGHRFDYILNYCQTNKTHFDPEKMLKIFSLNLDLTPKQINWRMCRLRANNNINFCLEYPIPSDHLYIQKILNK